MKNRQLKRWCDECKMQVFASGHEHGQIVDERAYPGLVMPQSGDVTAAVRAAEVHTAEAAMRTKLEANDIFMSRIVRDYKPTEEK